jgi:hypothetical protein
MTYDRHDAAMDEMFERMSDELYPEHKVLAIGEYTAERLRSYYVNDPMVMRPAVDALQEAKRLQANGHHSASVVFSATAAELLLKATILKPVVFGLVHLNSLAEIVVQNAVGGTGYARYEKLLSKLFLEFVNIEIRSVQRAGAGEALLIECAALRTLRNDIVHQGKACTTVEAEWAITVGIAVYELIVAPMLVAIGLTTVDKGAIVVQRYA